MRTSIFLFLSGWFIFFPILISAQFTSNDELTLYYRINPNNKAALYNPFVLSDIADAAVKEVMLTSREESILVSIHAKKKVMDHNITKYAIQLIDQLEGYEYTIISFAEEKAVLHGIVENKEVILEMLPKGFYSLILRNEDHTIVQTIEKK